jgi:transcriptional regulator of met regulon
MRPSNSNPNPPYGDKGQFRKLTVTVPPEVYERLIQESARRKIAGESNQLLSALLREALSDYLDRIEMNGASEKADAPHAA